VWPCRGRGAAAAADQPHRQRPAKLCDYLIDAGIVATMGREPLRRIVREGGVAWQATTTWKAGTDAELLPKMRRVLDLATTGMRGRA
jgi:hypothetical protein